VQNAAPLSVGNAHRLEYSSYFPFSFMFPSLGAEENIGAWQDLNELKVCCQNVGAIITTCVIVNVYALATDH
jgi:hypothetical protein